MFPPMRVEVIFIQDHSHYDGCFFFFFLKQYSYASSACKYAGFSFKRDSWGGEGMDMDA